MNKPQEFTSPVNHRISGRERLLKALAHQEPDRVPIDLGSTQVTDIHVIACHRLRQVLGLPPAEAQICDHIQGLALPDTDVIERLGVDVRGLFHSTAIIGKSLNRRTGSIGVIMMNGTSLTASRARMGFTIAFGKYRLINPN